MYKDITTADFESFIQQDKPVLLDFWAAWCGPCRMLAPMVEEIAEKFGDALAVGKVDVDKCPELAKQYRVMSIPTLMLFKAGKLLDTKIGVMPKGDLEAFVSRHM